MDLVAQGPPPKLSEELVADLHLTPGDVSDPSPVSQDPNRWNLLELGQTSRWFWWPRSWPGGTFVPSQYFRNSCQVTQQLSGFACISHSSTNLEQAPRPPISSHTSQWQKKNGIRILVMRNTRTAISSPHSTVPKYSTYCVLISSPCPTCTWNGRRMGIVRTDSNFPGIFDSDRDKPPRSVYHIADR
jgi:hypothetical protein